MFHRIMQILLPPCCVLCSRPSKRDRNLCIACEQDLPMIAHSCAKCAQKEDASLRWHDDMNDWQDTAPRHPCEGRDLDASLRWHDGKYRQYDRIAHGHDVYSLFSYVSPVTKLITGLKFHHKLACAQALAELMAEKVPIWYAGNSLPNLIIPVPLHPLRMRERGFNQALEIARPVGKKLGIPIDCLGAQRIKHTERQSSLSGKKRRKNIANAFTCAADYSGQHIAVLDDVVTTGQTVKEFCKVLQDRGAAQVDVWCCARV